VGELNRPDTDALSPTHTQSDTHARITPTPGDWFDKDLPAVILARMAMASPPTWSCPLMGDHRRGK